MRLIVVIVIIVILLLLSLTGCTSTASSSTPAFTQTTTTEPTATESTPTAPTTTEPELPTTGNIQGRLISVETQEPLVGATVILGLVTGESECTLQSNLIASADEYGAFQLADVPPGMYIVFYDPTGNEKEAWSEIDKLKIIYELIGKQHKVASYYITNELYDTLGGGGKLIGHYGAGATIRINNGIIESITGSHAFTSLKYGLTIQFTNGEPTSLEVKAGETVSVDIAIMITDVTPPDSSDS
jgi:hypothetical protein